MIGSLPLKPLLSKFYAIQESKIFFATGSKCLKGSYSYKLNRSRGEEKTLQLVLRCLTFGYVFSKIFA